MNTFYTLFFMILGIFIAPAYLTPAAAPAGRPVVTTSDITELHSRLFASFCRHLNFDTRLPEVTKNLIIRAIASKKLTEKDVIRALTILLDSKNTDTSPITLGTINTTATLFNEKFNYIENMIIELFTLCRDSAKITEASIRTYDRLLNFYDTLTSGEQVACFLPINTCTIQRTITSIPEEVPLPIIIDCVTSRIIGVSSFTSYKMNLRHAPQRHLAYSIRVELARAQRRDRFPELEEASACIIPPTPVNGWNFQIAKTHETLADIRSTTLPFVTQARSSQYLLHFCSCATPDSMGHGTPHNIAGAAASLILRNSSKQPFFNMVTLSSMLDPQAEALIVTHLRVPRAIAKCIVYYVYTTCHLTERVLSYAHTHHTLKALSITPSLHFFNAIMEILDALKACSSANGKAMFAGFVFSYIHSKTSLRQVLPVPEIEEKSFAIVPYQSMSNPTLVSTLVIVAGSRHQELIKGCVDNPEQAQRILCKHFGLTEQEAWATQQGLTFFYTLYEEAKASPFWNYERIFAKVSRDEIVGPDGARANIISCITGSKALKEYFARSTVQHETAAIKNMHKQLIFEECAEQIIDYLRSLCDEKYHSDGFFTPTLAQRALYDLTEEAAASLSVPEALILEELAKQALLREERRRKHKENEAKKFTIKLTQDEERAQRRKVKREEEKNHAIKVICYELEETKRALAQANNDLELRNVRLKDQCAICLDPCHASHDSATSAVMLPCSHTYHRTCIEPWLGIKRICPLCKRDFSGADSGLGEALARALTFEQITDFLKQNIIKLGYEITTHERRLAVLIREVAHPDHASGASTSTGEVGAADGSGAGYISEEIASCGAGAGIG